MSKQIGHQPLVSIIMPAYNAEKYIAEAIESIIAQTYTNWELLIADDGSTDNTIKIISEYEKKEPRIKTDHNSENVGYLKTCNKLFKLCNGDFITFQDADDLSQLSRLEKQAKVLMNNDDIGLCGTWFNTINHKGKIINKNKRPVEHTDIIKSYTKTNPLLGASAMIKNIVFKEIGGYRSYFDNLAYQDYDWVSLIIEKYKSYNIPEYLYYYRQYSFSNSKKISPLRIISDDIVRFLIEKRKIYGKDSIQTGNMKELDDFINNRLIPFEKDPSLLYRLYARSYFYNGMELDAIRLAFKAFFKNPFKIVNLRDIIYITRKMIIKN